MSSKDQLLYEFSSCLDDFWGEEPTKRGIVKAWECFLDAVRENEEVPKSYYKLTKGEKMNLYRQSGL